MIPTENFLFSMFYIIKYKITLLKYRFVDKKIKENRSRVLIKNKLKFKEHVMQTNLL